jgi:hypothetical protein
MVRSSSPRVVAFIDDIDRHFVRFRVPLLQAFRARSFH